MNSYCLIEIWRNILNTNYEVSNIGNIRHIKTKNYTKQSTSTTSNRFYVKIKINGKGKHLNVAREVAKAFISNPNNLPQVNHKDGNKLNNNVENLEWISKSDNEKHAFANNLKTPTKGELSGMSKLKNEDVKFIKQNYKPYDKVYGCHALGRMFNVNSNTISSIIRGETWKHINI